MFSVQELLQPISGSNPCGEDISFSAELDAINEARRHDDPSLDQGEWVTSLKDADWGFVIERCTDLLATKTKDLKLAVWFAEAGAKAHAFRGLGNGYSLVAGLCNEFWDEMYPLPEEGDFERRIGNLSWLLSSSVRLVQTMPITEGKGSGFSVTDFESARAREAQAAKLAAEGRPPEAGPKLAEMEAARRKSSRTFYEKLLEDAKYCFDSLKKMEAAVDARLGIDGPGFSATLDALDGVIRVIARYAGEAGVAVAGATAVKVENLAVPAGQVPQSTVPAQVINAGPLQSRAQALAQLKEVATFFKNTEPHSPVAYLADKAVAWADMPLHSWLRTIVKDQASLSFIEEMLGVDPNSRQG